MVRQTADGPMFGVVANQATLALSDKTYNVSLQIFHFIILAGTDASFLPALFLVAERKRHFELFVAVFQFVAALMYNTMGTLGLQICLVAIDDWHNISDIMTETLVMLIAIHLLGLRSEDKNTGLRYLAFAGAWLAKLADGWSAVIWEAMMICAYVLPALATISGILPRPPYRWEYLQQAGFVLLWTFPCFVLAQMWSVDVSLVERVFPFLLMSICHVGFGASMYFFWKSLPCMDKKQDELPQWY